MNGQEPGVRTSVLGSIKVGDFGLASIFQAGDNVEIKAVSIALAVQRELANFQGGEGENLNEYAIFPMPLPKPPIVEPIEMTIDNTECPYIRVQSVDIEGAAASSVIQIGNNVSMETESRVKHIRQLLSAKRPV
jgi:spore germination protein PE